MQPVGDLSAVSIRAFSYLLKLFNVVGFFNFPLHLHQTVGIVIGEPRWTTFSWWWFHCLYTILSCVMAKFDYNCLYSGMELTDVMNNYFRHVVGMVTVFVFHVDSWCSAGKHRSIWKCYQALGARYGTYLGLLNRSGAAAAMRRTLMLFAWIVAAQVTVQYKAFYTLIPGTRWKCFWMYNLYSVSMSYLRHVFHVLHIGMMCENLKQLLAKLKHLRQTVDDSLKFENITLNPRTHEAGVLTTLEHLEDCRQIYTKLWQANESINELFGFSQAFNVACSFIQIAFDLYWVRAMWMTDEPHLDLQMFFCIPTSIILGFLLYTTRNYLLVVESLKQAVLEMPCLHDQRMVQLRGHFLGQLLRFRFRLTARNIFDFDKTLLPKFAFVIATYFIIFIEINR